LITIIAIFTFLDNAIPTTGEFAGITAAIAVHIIAIIAVFDAQPDHAIAATGL
tara:strand:- start:897 stop:1055 length:159 start_codon:yes stop_codon:yes gene_type:complete